MAGARQASKDYTPSTLEGLSERERQRRRVLGLRFRMRRNSTRESVLNVMLDVGSHHGAQLDRGQTFDLLSGKAPR